MATESITHNFVLDDEMSLRFAEALWESKENYVPLGRDIKLPRYTEEELDEMIKKEVRVNCGNV